MVQLPLESLRTPRSNDIHSISVALFVLEIIACFINVDVVFGGHFAKAIFQQAYKKGCISGTKRATETLWILTERVRLMLSNGTRSISVSLLVLEI